MNNYKREDISEDEVQEVLNIANEFFTKELVLQDLKKEFPDKNLPNNYFVDRRLGKHEANVRFATANNINDESAIKLVQNLEVKHFCHYEIDSKDKKSRLYCFKLPKDIYVNEEGQAYFSDDILVKFKFRPNEINTTNLYLMSLHYPDHSKPDWTYLYKD